MTPAPQWYYAHANQQRGPVDDGVFRAMAVRGEIARTDLVWKAGMAQWAPASSVSGLFPEPVLGQPPPIPPPMVGYYTPPPPDIGQDPKMRMLLPVGRSGLSIAAGYLGLFSLIPIFAPVAIIVSLLAIRELRRKRHLHGMGRAVFGLIMGIVMTGVVIIGIVTVSLGAR
jgi:hypothetical protein